MDDLTQTPVAPPGSAPPAADLTGRTLGDYAVLRRLGQGGMGMVYLAEQLSLRRKVALKILRADLAENPVALKRFREEATAVARATHANIVQVYQIGEAAGLHYMALEYVEGWNLRHYLDKKGPPELLLALSIMGQGAQALARAAELGIVHRDIKPENILLTRKGEVKVADFGLSRVVAGDGQPLRLTQSGVTLGTPLYMSPEQVEGRPLDPRTDIYSFGVTCYHMLAGQPPFQGGNAFEVALMHVRAEPPPLRELRPDLPAALDGIVHKMMAKDPAARYQTGRELTRDIARLREGLSGQTAAFNLGAAPGDSQTAVATEPAAGTGSAELRDTGPRPSAPLTQPLTRPARRPWLLAGATVLAALGAGAALAVADGWGLGPAAWFARSSAGATAPQDAALVEAVLSPQASRQREESLRFLVNQHLTPGGPPEKLLFTFDLCLELGGVYLEQNRLDEAEKLFVRLEQFQRTEGSRPYRVMGRMGRGIVLALRNDAAGSNKLFEETVQLPEAAKAPAARLWQDKKFRFWLAQALYYNATNGAEPPPALKPLTNPVARWQPEKP